MADYTTLAGVRLSAAARRFVAAVSRDVSKPVVVTSGARTPHSQAQAMYDKFTRGGSYQVYRQRRAAMAIHEAFVVGRKQRQSERDIVRAMAEVIEKQMRARTYISRQLHPTALELRTRDCSPSEREALAKACRAHRARVVIQERHPPHLHVQF
ncbi:hypothetical protein [uncultured Salinisphaera sp.]|uniref:hypothetical protein n=1 Tax=uncultured Salinisphaera sp. TaxID=359372 RepID=UPI0032B1D958